MGEFVQMGAGAGGMFAAVPALLKVLSEEPRQWAAFIRTEVIKANQSDNDLTWSDSCTLAKPDPDKLLARLGDGWTVEFREERSDSHVFSVNTTVTANKRTMLLKWRSALLVAIDGQGWEHRMRRFVTDVTLRDNGGHYSQTGWSLPVHVQRIESDLLTVNGATTVVVNATAVNGRGTRSVPMSYAYEIRPDDTVESMFADPASVGDVVASRAEPGGAGMRARIRESNLAQLHRMVPGKGHALDVRVSPDHDYVVIGSAPAEVVDFVEAELFTQKGTIEYHSTVLHPHGEWIVRGVAPLNHEMVTTELRRISDSKKITFG